MIVSQSVERSLAVIQNDTSKLLGLTIGNHTITPGTHVPSSDTSSPPELSFPSASTQKTYLAIGLDLDVPFPSFSALGPLLHWIQPGLKLDQATSKLTSTQPFIVNWIPATPPPGSGPHRYVFFLFEQPAGFDSKKYAPSEGQKTGAWSRIRFNLDTWVKEAQLDEAVAVNYFET